MTKDDFTRLLRFYLACIEDEDRRSLTRKVSGLHHSLISPWDDAEPLFYSEVAEVIFEDSLASDRKILLGGTALAGGRERLFYGYPVFLDDDGFLAPLYFLEVEIDHRGHDTFAMRPLTPIEIQLNHHIFRRQHVSPEELKAIQRELERPYGSFADRLHATFEILGSPLPNLDPEHLEPYPDNLTSRTRWLNRPILFKSERSIYTRHLRYELEQLAEDPSLLRDLDTTSAGVITELAPFAWDPDKNESARSPLLQVLPLNDLQEQAARSGLHAPITVVTGPPGTGKSQVVVDLLASSAAAGRAVLFASKNNKAVDVVRSRLRSILGDEYDWTLRLGSRRIMEQSKQEMESRLGHLRDASIPHPPTPQMLDALDRDIQSLHRRIKDLDSARAEYVRLERRRRLRIAQIDPEWIDTDFPHGVLHDTEAIDRLKMAVEDWANERPAGFLRTIRRVLFSKFFLRRYQSKLDKYIAPLPTHILEDLRNEADRSVPNPFAPLAVALDKLSRLAHWRIAEEACENALEVLAAKEPGTLLAQRLADLQEQRCELSRDQLRAYWTRRIEPRIELARLRLGQYFELSSRQRPHSHGILAERFRDAVADLSEDFPVWIVTNLSVRNALPLEPALFDLVIIDEASQCDIPSALPLLFRARRALIIGDPQQLRHISTLSPEQEEHLAVMHRVTDLLPSWSYNRCSLYSLAEGVTVTNGSKPVFLAEHYRSHPEIIEFSNHRFYSGQLILRTDMKRLLKRFADEPLGLFWHDVRGHVPQSARSAVNDIEVQGVIELFDGWADRGFLTRDDIDFGVVTPFRLQMERIEEALHTRPWWNQVEDRIIVGTAHRFQGDERDIMIFSPVVSNGMRPRLIKWVAETEQLLNVAITRARGALHIVGDMEACLNAGGSLADLSAAASSSQDGPMTEALLESPAEKLMVELLRDARLWFSPQYPIGRHRLDFLVITPFGTRYDLEVDGRGHYTDDGIRSDEVRDASLESMGLKILRIEARQIFHNEDGVRKLLQHLV